MVPVAGTGIGQDWTDSTTLQKKLQVKTMKKRQSSTDKFCTFFENNTDVAGIVAGAQKMAP